MGKDNERDALRCRQSCAISIILLRVKYSVSRAELARYLGISAYRLKRYKTAEDELTSEAICKLAGYFDVSVDFFSALADRPRDLAWFMMRALRRSGLYGVQNS